jgi:hypothetical protein
MKLVPTFRSHKTLRNCWFCVAFWCFFVVLWSGHTLADQITHKFKSPSFNGVNTSSHYLTIENQEFNRKSDIADEIKAYQEELERDAENTTLARFIRNLESRIYAELSRQLVNNLFGETAGTGGTIELEGNTITYTIDGDFITLIITDANGNTTEITLPIGTFTF